MVIWSTGKKPVVAPYSGAMFAIVARSGSDSDVRPGPWNSTNWPTTPSWRSSCVMVRTASVAVAFCGSWPVSLNPTTDGVSMYIG